MTVGTLLGFWDGFGDIEVYNNLDTQSPCYSTHKKDCSYMGLIAEFGECEIYFFGTSNKPNTLAVYLR